MNNQNRIQEIAQEIATLVECKNNDYNHAFEKDLIKYGPVAYAMMIDHKLARFHALAIEQKRQMVKDETVQDTIKDIIGYSLNVLEIMEREGQRVEVLKEVGSVDY